VYFRLTKGQLLDPIRRKGTFFLKPISAVSIAWVSDKHGLKQLQVVENNH
jgi:hypothetical protein